MADSEPIPFSVPEAAIEASLEDIYLAQNERLIMLLMRITGDRGQAEDLASEALCRLSARPALLRPGGNLEGWLYRTAMNLGLDALKAQGRRARYEQAAVVEAMRSAFQTDPLDGILRAERQQHVRNVLTSLSACDAQILMLRHSGFSYQEMAEIVRINPASVGKRLARAMAEFKKRYSEKYGRER
jgi:RNA polymerase sigma factor (sigma-70 family)